MDEEKVLQERKEKIFRFFKNKSIWVILLLIVLVVLGVYIRSLPMQIHSDTGKPGLWDVAKDSWTLGPDLDPWLFTRNAKSVVEMGGIPQMDYLRNVPLGFDNSRETQLLSYMIAGLYKVAKIFYTEANVEFAASLLPVIMFALTIVTFFLFVREVFIREGRKNRLKANIISLVSTFFMIVIPVFLSRTIAGIPEKESAAFAFLFLAFFLFLKAWKLQNKKGGLIFAIFAGVSTAIMGLVSGLYIYIYVTIFLASFIAFLIGKASLSAQKIYITWWATAAVLLSALPGKVGIRDLITSISVAPAFFLIGLFVVHFLIWKTRFSNNNYLKRIKIPKNVFSLIVSLVGAFVITLIFNPSLILEKIEALGRILFNPTTGRWNRTVAENQQPYFIEWVQNFGPFIKGLALMFWVSFLGAVMFFRDCFKKINKKDLIILIASFILLFGGIIFSRYSSTSIFNGENFASKFLYLIGIIVFVFVILKKYFKYDSKGENIFKEIPYENIFLISLFFFAVFSARSAIRLVMILGPILPIFATYGVYSFGEYFLKQKGNGKKVIWGALLILGILLLIFSGSVYYKSSSSQAYHFVPSGYNQQWQKAMDWVRSNTSPTIIEGGEFKGGTVFAHWWDYGYWIQSIGERATILDGGNSISFWNYYMGRFVLTTNNQTEALDFLYSHNATHLLIDPTDISKYSAFSSIGSDENYDRLSWVQMMERRERETFETNNETNQVYSGVTALDEDLVIFKEGKEILLPSGSTAVTNLIVPFEKKEGGETISQPSVVLVYNGEQYIEKLKYLKVGEQFYTFSEGLEAAAYIFPKLSFDSGNVGIDRIGAAIFVTPRLMRSMTIQKYILEDPFKKYQSFELAHREDNIVVSSLNSQGADLPKIIYYQGFQGPIEIYKINYLGNEKFKEEYIDIDPSKYISWEL